jgi:hypothetical protein
MRSSGRMLRRLGMLALLAGASGAAALPITLKDSNGTRYNINTAVEPVIMSSNASGAITDATFLKPVTITSFFVGFTPFFGFTTVFTIQRRVNVPLTNAFNGFNGLLVTAVNGQELADALLFNPGENLASEECPQNGKNRQLVFQTQTSPMLDLQLTRKVFVPHNGAFLRWLNVVTNTGPQPVSVSLALLGLLGSGTDTRITSTSTGEPGLSSQVQWFTTAQQTPEGTLSRQPKLGFVVQGPGAEPPPSVAINSLGRTGFVYTPSLEPGASAIVMTFVTVQGNKKQAKKTVKKLVTLPAKAIACLTQPELQEIVNFARITLPVTKKATITLDFKKTNADTVKWNGTITIGAGISLSGLPVTIDVGGAAQTFVLNEKGRANNGRGNKFSLEPKLKHGVTKAGTAKFSFQLKGDFTATFADDGLVDGTVKNVPVTVPASFTAGAQSYATEQAFTYTATQGKKGTAKSS